MASTPIIDPAYHRLPTDAFGTAPSSSTPLDPCSTHSPTSCSSEWSFSDDEELIVLDLGTERVAKRAILGYAGGLDYVETAASGSAASSSARTVRTTTAAGRSNTLHDSSSHPSTHPVLGSTSHLAAGKQLSITGLETAQPLMKINDTVLRGSRMQMFGSEIVLKDDFDATRDRGDQHRLQPLASPGARADAKSSTSRNRILFRPIYDPASREAGGGTEAYDSLRRLVSGGNVSVGGELGATSAAGGVDARVGSLMEPEAGVGRGKYKRKEVSEEEQMIRAAERKIRKAAKAHFKQQQQEKAAEAEAQEEARVAMDSAEASRAHPAGQEQDHVLPTEHQLGSIGDDDLQQGTIPRQPQPPPSFDQQ